MREAPSSARSAPAASADQRSSAATKIARGAAGSSNPSDLEDGRWQGNTTRVANIRPSCSQEARISWLVSRGARQAQMGLAKGGNRKRTRATHQAHETVQECGVDARAGWCLERKG